MEESFISTCNSAPSSAAKGLPVPRYVRRRRASKYCLQRIQEKTCEVRTAVEMEKQISRSTAAVIPRQDQDRNGLEGFVESCSGGSIAVLVAGVNRVVQGNGYSCSVCSVVVTGQKLVGISRDCAEINMREILSKYKN